MAANAGHPASGQPRDWLFAAVAFQLAMALLVGGTARPLNVLLCFLASLPTLYVLLAGIRAEPLGWLARIALALYGLAWLQLIPLPPSVWTELPGRGLAAQVLDVSGLSVGWRPFALDPGAALSSLVSVAPALVLLIAASRLTTSEFATLIRAVVMLAVLTAFLGIVQRVTGGLNLYDPAHAGYATGMFANRNHHAAFLACAIVLLPAIGSSGRLKQGWLIAAGTAILLFVGILASTSRAGLALGALASFLCAAMLVKFSTRMIVVGLAICALATFILLQVPALDPVFDRFTVLGEDQRLIMAETSWYAAREMLPWGSGWGSFVPVYMAYEDLDTMSARYVVAAHNDYLQLILEGGLLGLVIALAAPLALAGLALRTWGRSSSLVQWCFWWLAILLLAHSAVDYPLRTSALAALFAIAFGAQEIGRKALPASDDAD